MGKPSGTWIGLWIEFAALTITHEAANNLGHQAAEVLRRTDIEQGSYRNQFQAAPADAMANQQPTAPGPQTAIVVAQEGEPLTTDRDGRIRVQFGWQRGPRPLAGALNAPTAPTGADTGHAPGNSSSGSWVRVAQHVASPNWGTVFTPRQGSEVIIDFIDGDIDRPIVVRGTTASTTCPGQQALTPAPTTPARSQAGTARSWTARAPSNGLLMMPKASCACACCNTAPPRAFLLTRRVTPSGWKVGLSKLW
jgi:uncharacterized protein involved in type VI secretion and phage assembly